MGKLFQAFSQASSTTASKFGGTGLGPCAISWYATWNGRALRRWRRGEARKDFRLVRELRPAAVTLDIMMPDLDGWTVLAGSKAIQSCPVFRWS